MADQDHNQVTASAAQSQQAQTSGSRSLNPENVQKFIQYQNAEISADTQIMLNNPLVHEGGIDPKNQEFLAMVMEKVDKGEIDLYRPSTLLNNPVYDKLSPENQGKADYEAMNLLGTIREIRKLWNLNQRDTYQIENLAHRIRVTKERLEEVGGDIYII